MKKITKIINKLTSILLISAFLIFVGLGAFFISSISNIDTKEIKSLIIPKYSIITDENDKTIEDFRENSISYVKIKDIPQILIDALISIEDKDFYIHNGINEKRILTSLIKNINPNNNTQGASTLTQQLVKNLLLTNQKTYKRKIQEAYLAIQLENKLSKDEILELYFNRIYFEQSVPGIQYASYKFFNKDVSDINLPEAALLAGLVKSPSYYYPFTNQDQANKRKNEVLLSMLKNKKITSNQYELAIKFTVDNLLSKISNKTINFQNQAYLDVVYKEVKELTNLDVFTTPLKVETYIDTYIQNRIDKIQNEEIIKTSYNLQQIGGAILNKDSNIIGIIGGKNYNGKKIFNHAYDLKTSPASTMKPILSYALGVEYLHLDSLSTINDEPYTYPNSNTQVNNADKKYLGKIPLIDALGYSRNTCAISTLEKVIKKIGTNKVIDYLKNINIMDDGEFTYSYAIGGMKYGVSPVNIAGAYSMLLNDGKYRKPSTIKRIISLETNEVLYEDHRESKQIISEESADIITNILERIIDNNYLSMKIAKPANITIAGKTGTGAYSKSIINKYNLPSNADKDIWFSGYSPNYTCSIWTGFTEFKTDEQSYFSSKEGKNVSKLIFKDLIEHLESKKENFDITDSLTKVYVVKGLDKAYLPNELIPYSYISFSYYKKEDIPTEILPYPFFNTIELLSVVLYENTLCLSIKQQNANHDIYEDIFGNKGYLITIKQDEMETTYFTINPDIEIELLAKGRYEISICETYKNNNKIKGDLHQITYLFE